MARREGRPAGRRNENILSFERPPAKAVGADALDLVYQAAEIFNGIEQDAREIEARAHAMCKSAAERLKLAEQRTESAEHSLREVVANADRKLADASRVLDGDRTSHHGGGGQGGSRGNSCACSRDGSTRGKTEPGAGRRRHSQAPALRQPGSFSQIVRCSLTAARFSIRIALMRRQKLSGPPAVRRENAKLHLNDGRARKFVARM